MMRGYMARKCDPYFTLENVAKMDVRTAAAQVMQELFKSLAMRYEFSLPDAAGMAEN